MKFRNVAKERLCIGRSFFAPGEFELPEPLTPVVQERVDQYLENGLLEKVEPKAKPEPEPEPKKSAAKKAAPKKPAAKKAAKAEEKE